MKRGFNMKKSSLIFVLLLVLSTVMIFAACGGDGEAEATKAPAESTDAPTAAPDTDPTDAPAAGKYKVTVVDTDGNPIADALVQLCLNETCNPAKTDANGVASFNVDDADYKVSFLRLPDGYNYSGEETEFYFADGSYEMTITLAKAA